MPCSILEELQINCKSFSPQFFHYLVFFEKVITKTYQGGKAELYLVWQWLQASLGHIKSSAFERLDCEQSDLMMNASTVCNIALPSIYASSVTRIYSILRQCHTNMKNQGTIASTPIALCWGYELQWGPNAALHS
jgi:hypothetical protein